MCHRQIKITTYDRLLRAWENSMEAVRDFQSYADLTEDNDKAKQAFYDLRKTVQSKRQNFVIYCLNTRKVMLDNIIDLC